MDWTSVLRDYIRPLIFLINIDDPPQYCDSTDEMYIFADDAKIFRHIKSCSGNTFL